jgi:hypothetical protein
LFLLFIYFGKRPQKDFAVEGFYIRSFRAVQLCSAERLGITKEGSMKNLTKWLSVAAIGAAMTLFMAGCEIEASLEITTDRPSPTAPKKGVYIGVISFAAEAENLSNQLVYLDGSGKSNLDSAMNSYRQGAPGTALFYGVHKALANLTANESNIPTDVSSINIITFTDGLDISSGGIAAEKPIEGQSEISIDNYASYIRDEIRTRTIRGKPITAYSIGVKGDDVTDETKFNTTLTTLASSSSNVHALTNFVELQRVFSQIANGVSVSTSSTNFTLKTPRLDSGTKVRMTFDSAESAIASNKYIEGTIQRVGSDYSFNNIMYSSGITSDSGNTIAGQVISGEVTFVFRNLTGCEFDPDKISQWLMSPSETTWNPNSEYNVAGATQTETQDNSAVICLVLDASRSLSSDAIATIKQSAQGFIFNMYNRSVLHLPGAPIDISCEAVSSSSIRVSWPSVSGATGYNVYWSSTPTPNTAYRKVGSTGGTSLTVNGFQPSQTVYFTVTSVNSYGESNDAFYFYNSATTLSGGLTAPAAPTGVIATRISANDIRVAWSAVSGATSYKVYYANSSTGTYALDGTTTATYYTSSDWEASLTGYFKVTAVNAAGESAYSAVASATTLGSSVLSLGTRNSAGNGQDKRKSAPQASR